MTTNTNTNQIFALKYYLKYTICMASDQSAYKQNCKNCIMQNLLSKFVLNSKIYLRLVIVLINFVLNHQTTDYSFIWHFAHLSYQII